jgi:ComF family protein
MESVRPLESIFCAVCGEALVSRLFEGRPDALRALCQPARPPFEKAVAYRDYGGALRDLIHLLKYHQIRRAANILGRKLAETMAQFEANIAPGRIAVVPVPLHRRQRSQRGFDQSQLLVRTALKRLRRPQRLELLMGRRETEFRIGRTRHQRRENLRGTFAVKSEQLRAGGVLVVDDAFTSGTTALRMRGVLQKAGVARVWVVTMARKFEALRGQQLQNGANEAEQELAVA